MKKLLLEEGINRRKEDSYQPSHIFQSSGVHLWFKVCSSVQKCVKQYNSMCLSALSVFLVWLRELDPAVRVLEVCESNKKLLLCKFLLFLFIFEVIVLDYHSIYIIQFIIVYSIVKFQAVYIYKRVNCKLLSRDQIYDQVYLRDFLISTSILKS